MSGNKAPYLQVISSHNEPNAYEGLCEDDAHDLACYRDRRSDDLHEAWKSGEYQGKNPDELTEQEAQTSYADLVNRRRQATPYTGR